MALTRGTPDRKSEKANPEICKLLRGCCTRIKVQDLAARIMNRADLLQKARAAADQVLRAKGYISIVDVLLAMGRLSKDNYERWRLRQIPHLEKVLPGSLNEHAFLGRE